MRLLALIVPLAVLSGCASVSDEEESSQAAASTEGAQAPAEDATVVTTDETPTDARSAVTTLRGFIPGRTSADVLQQLLTLSRWTEVRFEGEQVFAVAEASRESAADGGRVVEGQLVFGPRAGNLAVDVELSGGPTATGHRFTFTNRETVRLIGFKVIEARALRMDLDLRRDDGGVRVEGTTQVKMKRFEDRAKYVTQIIAPVFDWVSTAR